MAETTPPAASPPVTLTQAGQRLDMPTRQLANLARQHGFFTAIGRNLVFTEAHLKAIKAMLKEDARAEARAAARRKRPKSTFGVNESAELRKERRRSKKRQAKKEE